MPDFGWHLAGGKSSAMGIFNRAPKWEEVYQINGSLSGIRFLLGLLFWVWGLGGFALVIVDMLELMSKLKEGVGVGSSSFLAAIAVVWIGGMVFFGMGALIAGSKFNLMQRVQDEQYGDVRVGG
jgi:hypothetical protein